MFYNQISNPVAQFIGYPDNNNYKDNVLQRRHIYLSKNMYTISFAKYALDHPSKSALPYFESREKRRLEKREEKFGEWRRTRSSRQKIDLG